MPLVQDTLRIGSPTHVSRCKRSLSPNHPKQSGLSESADFWNSAGNLRAVTSGRVSDARRCLRNTSAGTDTAARPGVKGDWREKRHDRRRVSKLAVCLLITLQAVESAALTSPQWKRYLQLCSPLRHMLPPRHAVQTRRTSCLKIEFRLVRNQEMPNF